MNVHRGEVELKVGDQVLTLRFSIDAICALEAATGKGLPVLAVELADPKTMTLTLVREVLYAGLREHHPDIALKDAGELIMSAGGMLTVLGKVSEALQAAFPQMEGEKRTDPQTAPRRAGTGRRS